MSKSFKDIIKEKQERAERNERPKVEWFSLKNNETKYIRFLQEFDTDMRNYDSKFGTAHFPVEHVSPHQYSRRALCSQESEGRCFACEMDKEEPSLEEDGKTKWHPWGQKSNFYVYVADAKGDVRVLSRPTNGKFFDAIVEEIGENDNSLTDITFKISKGNTNQSPWEIRSTKKEHFELPEVPEVADLASAVGIKVAYNEQRNFYIPGSGKASVESPAVTEPASSKNASTIGEDW